MKWSSCLLAALLGCSSLAAADSGYDQLAQTILQADKVKEFMNAGTERMVQRLKEKGLPPAGQEEVRGEVNQFMAGLIREGACTQPFADLFRDKLTEEEARTFAAFLQTSAGKKLMSGAVSIGGDREQMQRAVRNIMQAKAGELTAILKRVAGKHGIQTN